MRAIAIEEAEHPVVADPGVGQDHEDHRIEVIGGRLVRLDLADSVLEQRDLLGLVVREPGDATLEHPSGSFRSFWRATCRPWTTRAVVCGDANSP